MKVIKVEEFTPKQGEEYSHEKYPGRGVFIDVNGKVRILHTYPGSSVPCVIELGTGVAVVEIDETPVSQSCSMNDLLKAIAVTQKPELIKDICN